MTAFYKSMKRMQQLGEQDFKSGKPITAFPTRENRGRIAAMFSDRARAAYEMGWRNAWRMAEEGRQ